MTIGLDWSGYLAFMISQDCGVLLRNMRLNDKIGLQTLYMPFLSLTSSQLNFYPNVVRG